MAYPWNPANVALRVNSVSSYHPYSDASKMPDSRSKEDGTKRPAMAQASKGNTGS
jgi:hypothetical protein